MRSLRFALPGRLLLAFVLPFALAVGTPGGAAAQQGTLAGTVRASDTGAPLASVEVEVRRPDGSVVARDLAGPAGAYRITRIAPGTYDVFFTLPGWETIRRSGIAVRAGETTNLSVAMVARAYTLNPITVSTGRTQEKLLDAPAAVSVVNTRDVEEEAAALTPMEHVDGLAGIDVIRSGLMQGYVVARGFNNIFSGQMLTLTDHRIARVPSLRANVPHLLPTTNLDIERVEVVLGPGSALYGPNAANGVLHILTKSPIDHPGNAVAVSGGLREQESLANPPPVPDVASSAEGVVRAEARVAHRFSDEFGAKISGLYFGSPGWEGNDWVHFDETEREQRVRAQACLADYVITNSACQVFAPSPGVLPDQDRLERIGERDFDLERWALDVRADWRPEEGVSAVLSAGLNEAVTSIDLTGIGAAQVDGFTAGYVQGRLEYDDLFAQVFWNKSGAGDSYILNTGQPIDDESSLLVGQIQHSYSPSDRQRFTYGADLLVTTPQTNGSINGVNEDDDGLTEFGGYVQSETRLGPMWSAILAARTDYHSVLDEAIFSPRAAVVFRPSEVHSFRATFNRAYATPDNNNLFLDILAQRIPLESGLSYGLRAQGTPETGFNFVRDPSVDPTGRPMMRSPFLDLPIPFPFFINSSETFVPSTTASLWQIAAGLVGADDPALGLAMQSAIPSEDEVGVVLRQLNTGEGQPFIDWEGGFGSIEDIPLLQEEITNTFELGYKGIVEERLLLSVAGYYTRIEDFIGPLRVETPNLFLNAEETINYLVTVLGLSPAEAEAAAVGTPDDPGFAVIPLGVVTPDETEGQVPSMLLTYRNFGDLDLFGVDISASYEVDERWTLGAATSWASDEEFDADGLPVALNAPELKARASVAFRDEETGVNGNVTYRFNDAFPASSGVFVGQVESYHTVDLGLGYRIPGVPAARVQVSVQNLFDTSYSTFPGAPELGRFSIARVLYEF